MIPTYKYENGQDNDYGVNLWENEFKLLRLRLNKGGRILYMIKCVANGAGYDNSSIMMATDFYDKIKSKCTIQSNERSGVFTVKPN